MFLSWTAAVGASHYRVAAAEDDEGLIISNVTSNVPSVQVSELQSGTSYTLNVTVYDSDGRQGNTVQAVVFTGNVLCFSCNLMHKHNTDELMYSSS